MEQRSKGDEGVSQWERVSASSGRAVRRPRGRAGPVALGGTGEQSGEEARAAAVPGQLGRGALRAPIRAWAVTVCEVRSLWGAS